MELTKDQEAAVKIIKEKYNKGDKYVTISGVAGSGKSFTASRAIEALGVNEDDVVYTSFTGKAVEVLKRFGCKHTSTIHHLMYESYPNSDGTFSHIRRKELPYRIIIIDEIGMVPNKLFNDLIRYKDVFFICLGDLEQLPPVDKNQDNHLLVTPHVFFTEIMRQALESEIIQLTMKIRNNEPINPNDYSKEVKILNYDDITTGLLLWPEQVICATNNTKIQYNNYIRDLKHPGLSEPQDGDKVICCRNYWGQDGIDEESEEVSLLSSSLVNGTTGIIHNPRLERVKMPIRSDNYKEMDWLWCDFESSTGEIYKNLYLDYLMLKTGKPTLPWEIQYRLYKKHPEMIPYEFQYGDVITCHKSQGSTFENVVVLEEGFPYEDDMHRRWLYTACTRPSKKLVLVEK